MQAELTTQAVILAGGRGKRLGPLTSLCPKSALPVGDRPFLAYIFAYLREQGVRDIIVCSGHLGQELEAFTRPFAGDVDIRYVREEQPLGTGGALRHCLPYLHKTFFVCHGDTLFRTPLQPLAQALTAPFAATLALREVSTAGHYTRLQCRQGVVQAFHGLQGTGNEFQSDELQSDTLTYGGSAVMRRASVLAFPVGYSSLENDFFPAAAAQGLLGGVRCEGLFWDVASPSAYAAAHNILAATMAVSINSALLHSTIRPLPTPRKAVFLDRDGTLIVEKNYLHNPEDVEILPHVVAGLGLLQKAGYALIVATNQSGIGRGYYSLEAMHAVNARLTRCLVAEGIHIDGVYHCPHSPDTLCLCRKPLPAMLARAAAELGLDMGRIASVGDKDCDVLMGQYLGGKGVRVRTGYGAQDSTGVCQADYVADTLLDAAKYIVHTV